jgi:Pvc16 N-terminal domain
MFAGPIGSTRRRSADPNISDRRTLLAGCARRQAPPLIQTGTRAMANYRAVAAACEAVVRLLQQSWRPELFDGAELQFRVFRTKSFSSPMDAGVSLFLYRVALNGLHRTPPARPGPGGRPRRPQLPLDLHFLLTPWAREASLEQEILGWMMRTIEDTPSLPAGLLNALAPHVFEPEETVEIVVGQMSNEELFRIWDVLPNDFQVSVPYVARIVRIDSELEQREGEPVLTRQLDFGVLKEP